LLERLPASHWRQRVGTALGAGWRLRHIPPGATPTLPSVAAIRPVRGLDSIEMQTLASTFQLPRTTELIFCAGRETDKTVLEAAE
jgi:hypothetical protein